MANNYVLVPYMHELVNYLSYLIYVGADRFALVRPSRSNNDQILKWQVHADSGRGLEIPIRLSKQ